MKKFLSLSLLTSFLATPAMAGQACYSPEELRAEHLLRLHSELMVITVTCHTGSQGENLIPAYTGFTKDNITALHGAEQTIEHYYASRNGGDGIEALDKMRTKLGNEYGQSIANISAPAYCQRYRDKVLALYRATPNQIENEVDSMMVSTKSYAPLCGTSVEAHNTKR